MYRTACDPSDDDCLLCTTVRTLMELKINRIESISQSVKVNPAAAVSSLFPFEKIKLLSSQCSFFLFTPSARAAVDNHSLVVPYIARSQLSFEKYHKVIRSSRRSRRRIELKEHYTRRIIKREK